MPSPYSTAQNTATAHRPQSFKDVIGQETPKAALKAIAKSPATSFHSITLAGPYGTGKCVSGDTLIQTAKGIRQIRSLFPTPKGESIPHREIRYDLPTPLPLHFGNTILPASYLFYSGVKPTIEIKTGSGKTLIGSYRHPVLTLNSETKRVEYVPLSLLTSSHFLIGVVTNNHPVPVSGISTEFLPLLYQDFLSLSYEDQILHVAAMVKDARSLSLRCSTPMYAQAIAAVAAVMGCYSYIETVSSPTPRYAVNLVPLMEDSILSRLVGPVIPRPVGPILSSYNLYSPALAGMCRGPIPYISECSQSEESSEALKMAEGSYLYADPVISVEEGSHIPLYDLHIPSIHAFIGEGYINHNTTLARVFAKAVNCFGRGRREIPSKTNRIGHRSVCGGFAHPPQQKSLIGPLEAFQRKGGLIRSRKHRRKNGGLLASRPCMVLRSGLRRTTHYPPSGVMTTKVAPIRLPPMVGRPLKSWPVVAKTGTYKEATYEMTPTLSLTGPPLRCRRPSASRFQELRQKSALSMLFHVVKPLSKKDRHDRA